MSVLFPALLQSGRKRTLLEQVGKRLEWGRTVTSLAPEVWCEEGVRVGDCLEGGLDKVTHALGVSRGRGVTVVDSSHLQQSLDRWGGDDTGSSWSWDETDTDGSTFTGNLDWDGVGFSEVGSPVSSTDGDDGQLGEDDGSTDGGSDFLGALDSETDVSGTVSDDDESLEPGPLTGTGLLLDWHDLHHLILESWEEVVDDLVLCRKISLSVSSQSPAT